MSSVLDLPGQPVPVVAPVPQIGDGLYVRDGLVRAAVIGSPQRDGSVCGFIFLIPSDFSHF